MKPQIEFVNALKSPMEFLLNIHIRASTSRIYTFFRDLYANNWSQNPVVPVYEKLTPGPVAVGTRFREVVRVLPPLIHFEIISTVTAIEDGRRLAYDWRGPGMHGELEYTFEPAGDGTHLTQRETLHMRGLGRLFNPLVRRSFGAQIAARLESLRRLLEGPPEPELPAM